jgi:prepilin-type processing-associated H-X9-DG protein
VNWWEGSNLAAGAKNVETYRCPSAPSRSGAIDAVAKPPRPAMTFPEPLAPTDYEAIMGVQPASVDPQKYNSRNRFAVMHRNSTVRFADILDGATSTLMVVECAGRPQTWRLNQPAAFANDQGIGWIDSEGPFSLDGANSDGSLEGCTPANGCNSAINKRNDNEPYSFHTGAANFLLADGRVRFISESVDFMTFAALCTRAASEVLGGTEY